MLYWKANFEIPNSGVQSAWVFVSIQEDRKTVDFYADQEKSTQLFTKTYDIPEEVDPYDYLLTLEEFSNYTKV